MEKPSQLQQISQVIATSSVMLGVYVEGRFRNVQTEKHAEFNRQQYGSKRRNGFLL
ncbi:hypothetical protein [Sporosarcina sp.]|uniref:hypothetical protein n=1 Tax=Sporosarcina sp. TaxID=49982 RepID=UPI002637305B|nr:hypothetical protein [Sporosarcina sp.]